MHPTKAKLVKDDITACILSASNKLNLLSVATLPAISLLITIFDFLAFILGPFDSNAPFKTCSVNQRHQSTKCCTN